MIGFNKSPQYKKFISKRDQALEVLLHNHLIDVDNEMKAFFTQAIKICYDGFLQARKEQDQYQDVLIVKRAEAQIEAYMPQVAKNISELIYQFRKRVFILTVSSESEAIAQALGKNKNYQIRQDLGAHLIDIPAPSGIRWERKVIASLMTIKDKLKAQLYWLILHPETENMEALQYLVSKLPKQKNLQTKKRSLKPWYMVEAVKKKREDLFDMSTGYIADEDWQDLIDELGKDSIFIDRSPEEVLGLRAGPKGETTPYYAWEFEQEMTNDFVKMVRSGQNEAANQAGITDFVVLSVIDDRTCEGCCGDYGCVDFDGKLVSEVEKMTKGEYSAPPYHFNCRCQMAPATENLKDFEPEMDTKEFDEWLNT